MRIVAILCCLLSTFGLQAHEYCMYRGALSDSESKTPSRASAGFSVEHYAIKLDITDFAGRTISGSTVMSIQGDNNWDAVVLDLEGLAVSAVTFEGNATTFTQDSASITIDAPTTANAGQVYDIEVFYAGTPKQDPSGFGGWYWSGNYSYNLGVAFQDGPHNYGRIWHPCIDNFTNRATYSYEIKTTSDKVAVCNGLLTNQTTNGDTITWFYETAQDFPTYLASVAVADYQLLEGDLATEGGPVPYIYAVRAADSSNLKASFINMQGCMEGFEDCFGPYHWERVGFVIVPFNGGAMEHATNIAYPRFAVDGQLTYESLMAHEFAHHWFGDLVTCETAEDMWLNEGWASYSEHIFFEHVYGRERYDAEVASNQLEVLQYAHARDGDYYPISGIGHEQTYSTHVYRKGASMAHTLRGYMDRHGANPTFFNCVTEYLQSFAFSHASSEDFRDYLSDCSGYDLSDFFEDNIFRPGWMHFEVQSWDYSDAGELYIAIEQKLHRSSDDFYENVPLRITVHGDNQSHTFESLASGACHTALTNIAFEPSYITIDQGNYLADAITEDYMTLGASGSYNAVHGKMVVDLKSDHDSTEWMHIQHHWVAPDNDLFNIEGQHLNDYRYWTVDGLFDEANFSADALILFDGRLSTSGGYLDDSWLNTEEDSIVLYYRPDTDSEWTTTLAILNKQGSATNKIGTMNILGLKKGQYTLGYKNAGQTPAEKHNTTCAIDYSVSARAMAQKHWLTVNPNPSDSSMVLRFKPLLKNTILNIYNASGQLVYQQGLSQGMNKVDIEVQDWTAGQYFAQLGKERVQLSVY